jgi:hypothetical protein
MNYTEEYWKEGRILRFQSYAELELYFEQNFLELRATKKKTKVIGLVLYIF